VRVNEDRLAELRSTPFVADRRPETVIGRAAVELTAGRAHAPEAVRAANALAFLLDDLGGIRLRVAADAVEHVSALPALVVRDRLGETAQSEPILGVACQAMAGCRFDGTRRSASEREEVERAVFLVLRMASVQEEVDALTSALQEVSR
jgi:hypothetical protein